MRKHLFTAAVFALALLVVGSAIAQEGREDVAAVNAGRASQSYGNWRLSRAKPDASAESAGQVTVTNTPPADEGGTCSVGHYRTTASSRLPMAALVLASLSVLRRRRKS